MVVGVVNHEQTLRTISRAWGKQSGYCFFPWISGKARDKTERIQSYREGRAFRWPRDRGAILTHMQAHENDDLYWCPSLFETSRRRLDQAMDEHALWADLDRVKPDELEEYPPTVAWETSPGRYQALWIVMGDIQGASWPGRENQRMTYHIGADLGGWDTTQLLRVPGWANHKPEYVQQYGEPPLGKLLWDNGRFYLPDDFSEIPEIPSVSIVSDMLEEEVDLVDRHAVKARIGQRVSKRVWEFLDAKEAVGDRSEMLWDAERSLADAGAKFSEILAVVKHSVWNKYVGRADEFKRLSTETAKALAERPESAKYLEKQDGLSEQNRLKKPQNLAQMLKGVVPPKWLVQDILTEGACGFIAGEPKSYKSWCSLDLALSIATGTPFLDTFEVITPGSVLWIQEEDPLPLIKIRYDKILPSKSLDKVVNDDGQIFWSPARELPGDPPLDAFVGNYFTISDLAWQSWLDEVLEEGNYKLCILDPLMMMAGDVEEIRAQQMTEKIFKPLKQLARRHKIALMIIHHMRKSDPRYANRGGQLMLGSMANHAWAEDSLYFRHGKRGNIVVERESKNSVSQGFTIANLKNKKWEPHVILPPKEEEGEEKPKVIRQARSKRKKSKTPGVLAGLVSLGPGGHLKSEIVKVTGLRINTINTQLRRLKNQGKVKEEGEKWTLIKD